MSSGPWVFGAEAEPHQLFRPQLNKRDRPALIGREQHGMQDVFLEVGVAVGRCGLGIGVIASLQAVVNSWGSSVFV